MVDFDMNNATFGRINAAYITTPEELALDEQVGRDAVDSHTGEHLGYRMGNLESMANDLRFGQSEFSQRFNLAAVIMDGDKDAFGQAWEQPIWPRELSVPYRTDSGLIVSHQTLEEMSIHMPHNEWRKLIRDRKGGESIEDFGERKAEAKARYETRMADVLDSRGVDLVISDSYTNIFGHTMLARYGGRILNIHPAITDRHDPSHIRGLTPTTDAFTRAMYGWIRVDNKKEGHSLPGQAFPAKYEGEDISIVYVDRRRQTGVTVHVVNELIDDGRIVMAEKYEFATEGLTPEKIRQRNYDIKRSILPQAMLEYSREPGVIRLYSLGREHHARHHARDSYQPQRVAFAQSRA